MIPSSQYLERNVKKVIGGCTVGKKGNRNPPRPQKHTQKVATQLCWASDALSHDRHSTMTAPNSIRFFFPRRPLSRIRRVDFNSTLTRSKIQKTTTKINVGMGIIMFALFSDGKRKKSTRSF
jgi:hypothetical protein